MSDLFHLSNEQQEESYEYSLIHGTQLTESTSITSSPISSITTVAPNHPAMFNWQPTIESASVNQYYHNQAYFQDYHHQHQQQQHLWAVPQQHHMSYSRNYMPSFDSIRLYNEATSYFQQPPSTGIPRYHGNGTSSFNSTYTTAAPTGEQIFAYYPHLDNSLPSPSIQSISFDHQGPSSSSFPQDSHPPRYQPKTKKKKSTKYINTTTTGSTSPPSPNTTPIPSPIIGGSKRKRRASIATARKKKDIIPEKSKQRAATVDRNTTTEHNEDESERGGTVLKPQDGVIVRPKRGGKDNRTVDQMENELAFLRDECATITIMLNSLRNAFLADIPSSSSTVASAKKMASSTATINFMVEDLNTATCHLTPTTQICSSKAVHVDRRRRSKTLLQNPEMEREMRIAYDDLMLQVRQLEKKLEKLEGKSKRLKKDDRKKGQLSDQQQQQQQQPQQQPQQQQQQQQSNLEQGQKDKDPAPDDVHVDRKLI